MTGWRRWWIAAAILIAAQVAIVVAVQRVGENRERESLPVVVEPRRDPAVDLNVETADGTRIAVRAQADRYRLVHFWATWCPPCREELPVLLELAGRRPDRLEVWAVSVDTEWPRIERFLGGAVPSAVVRDADGATARGFGVTELPDSYLIDPEGMIRARFFGPQNWSGREMSRMLADLMAGP